MAKSSSKKSTTKSSVKSSLHLGVTKLHDVLDAAENLLSSAYDRALETSSNQLVKLKSQVDKTKDKVAQQVERFNKHTFAHQTKPTQANKIRVTQSKKATAAVHTLLTKLENEHVAAKAEMESLVTSCKKFIARQKHLADFEKKWIKKGSSKK